MNRLRQAESGGDELDALEDCLDRLYKLREHRRTTSQQYDDLARNDPRGRVAEGVVLIRGKLTHDLRAAIEPTTRHLYPSHTLFPGERLFVGEFLRWRGSAELLRHYPDLLKRPEWFYYEAEVGHRGVLDTLEQAQSFLLEDALLGPLDGA